MKDWIKKTWCNIFHRGGHVKRDSSGRINWQCVDCGRWSTPVSKEEEQKVVDRDIEEYQR